MSIPSLTNLVEAWRDALVASTALSTFCTTNFSKACTFYVGFDSKEPPGESNAPFVVIIPNSTVDGQADGMFIWSIDIDFAVVDTTFEDYQSKGATEMKAFYLLDEMKGIIKDAIDDLALSNNLVADSVTYDVDADTHPLVVGSMSIETRFTNTIGASFSL